MEIRLFKYFLAVTEELHFTRAAEKLGISQPTLSQQIRLLESRLETTLFHRKGTSIELTESGKALLKHVNRIFYEMDQIKTEINEIEGKNFGELKIGSSGNHLLYSSLTPFHKEYPNIKVSVHDLKTIQTIENLISSSFDLGIVLLPVHHPQIEVIPLYTSELYVVVNPFHPLSKVDSVRLKNIQKYPLYLYPENYYIRKTITEYSKTIGLTLNPIVELSDTHSLIKMATLDNGVTILPKVFLDQENDINFQKIPIENEMPEIEVGVIYRKGMKLSTVIQTFIFHLKEFYNQEF